MSHPTPQSRIVSDELICSPQSRVTQIYSVYAPCSRVAIEEIVVAIAQMCALTSDQLDIEDT